MNKTLILGIETSCDETAAAVVSGGSRLHSNIIASQAELHRKYGGVVPEIASRRQLETVNFVIEQALAPQAAHFPIWQPSLLLMARDWWEPCWWGLILPKHWHML